MCEYVSFVVTKDGEQIFAGNLDSHEGIEKGWKLKPDQYREAEWTKDDHGESLVVRVCEGEDSSAYKAYILSKYPTRKDFLHSITKGKRNDVQYHYKDGKRHRSGDKPAVIYADGAKRWYKDGKLHRDGDKPAVIGSNGAKHSLCYWYKDDTFIK